MLVGVVTRVRCQVSGGQRQNPTVVDLPGPGEGTHSQRLNIAAPRDDRTSASPSWSAAPEAAVLSYQNSISKPPLIFLQSQDLGSPTLFLFDTHRSLTVLRIDRDRSTTPALHVEGRGGVGYYVAKLPLPRVSWQLLSLVQTS